jgi:hypothetical protein
MIFFTEIHLGVLIPICQVLTCKFRYVPIESKKVRLDFHWVWGVSLLAGASIVRVELPPTFIFEGQLKESGSAHRFRVY